MNWMDLELDEDPATLRAALEMLDALDEGRDASGAASPSEEDATDTTNMSETTEDSDGAQELDLGEIKRKKGTSETPEYVLSKGRNRRKEELSYLRTKVKQMEETLSTLKRRRTEDKYEGTMVVSKASRVWEDLAIRQQRQRQMVELENAKLRTMLSAQLKVGKDLMRLLQKGSRCEDERVMQMTRANGVVYQPNLTAEDQFNRVDQLYQLTNAAFASFPMDGSKNTFRDIKISEDDPNTTLVNFFVTWTLPFPKDQVLEATWQSVIQKAAKKNCGIPLAQSDNDDRMIAIFRSDASMIDKCMAGEVQGTMVAKKYAHNDVTQGVIITSIAAEMDKTKPKSLDDMNFGEDCWIRVMDITQPSELATQPLTQIQFNRRFRLHVVTDRSATQRRRAGALTEFVLAQIEEEVTWRQETIENLLLSSKLSVVR
ncbi:hypothetical protein Poli38472_004905 [Pythium oligandrum]|uniref:Uncharacterized protein n=1 Tax=Pythium oligandrum TaxID=41045 RepID=A0A8K1FEU9_PYTOL|nr:hypothetical protein Poli38472_004905 [Pythium oligandrum]|eukprot:TMW59836.1 hypothetical protein Poli38472_004905 [Pythium oligandrum]